ncbi:DNA polymerase II large subunit [Methanosarcina sp. WWM596]|uniref:DNA polymerase II large subunit n=1 Tax=Methanosarcina sp. WWM596 TaxID=1434103 RepID=UPI0006159242|nr:DNA polymerase II large subunit [Methanosarcina sp. WWM596]AKB16948.1 Archaeal DNA polymerase II large subunit [Methanosarcina sp. WWM596]
MGETIASEEMHEYFNGLEARLKEAIEVANRARSRGGDPKPTVEIPLAKDLADRVENLIGVKGVAAKIRELEVNMSREEAALEVGRQVAEGIVGSFPAKKDAVEAAIRVSMAVLTEGVVAAPIEGIDKVDLGKNDDGSQYIRIFYSGPIRSAGGTAQALSVLVGDYVRRGIGIDRYKPRDEEIERYVEEILLYKRVASLQYMPSEDEIRLIVRNCPVCIDGDPTEEAEVEGHRNLERIGTNRVRGGMCLVLAEGLALKAPKVKKHVNKLKMDGWDWLETLIGGAKSGESAEDEQKNKIKPKDKYIRDLIAGRPVFSHPSRPGGFRLRYGRSRNTSFASAGISPASMVLLDDFIANGTQLKVERPGKAAAMSAVDSIEGPTVRLFSGDLIRIDNIKEAYEVRPQVEVIVDIGEILINYGDFLENNHPLMPSPYVFEWWQYDYQAACPEQIPEDELKNPSAALALRLAEEFNVPLHPKFTYLWHDINRNEFEALRNFVAEKGSFLAGEVAGAGVLKLPMKASLEEGIKPVLEKLLVLHRVKDDEILIEEALPFILCLGLDTSLKEKASMPDLDDMVEAAGVLSGFKVYPRAPSRIGARMGRPEKSDLRKMSPAAQVLFPLNNSGGITRNLVSASDYTSCMNGKIGEIEVELGLRECPACRKETYFWRCECGEFTNPKLFCSRCKIDVRGAEVCPKCGRKPTSVANVKLDFRSIYKQAFENLGEREKMGLIKGVKRLMNGQMTPEPLEKGILRSKHNVYVFKDGTIRYDMSDIPLTHIRADELGITAAKLLELGYREDICGNPLERDDQVVCLKVQDLVISYDGAEYMLRTAKYVDDLLVKYYKIEPYYNAETIQDLVGVLLIGLAPHTSAGVLGRLIGFTKASVGYAHPFFHASKRRNCDGDEDCIMLLMDGILNFSRSYLPDKRGGKMDAPLVLTTRIDPKEVDKEAHNIDVSARYPFEFYRATQEIKSPTELESIMDLISSRLGTPEQYEHFMFTHDTSNIAAGPLNSSYKTLGSMIEKMEAQLSLANRIRAVDAPDVAERVLKSHFLPDLIGNLRSFSRQRMRCIKCGEKFRRPPLTGACPKCGGNVILTVHEGSVRKYLEISKEIGERYGVSSYTRQRIELLDYDISSLFENHRVKQLGLSDFMSGSAR